MDSIHDVIAHLKQIPINATVKKTELFRAIMKDKRFEKIADSLGAVEKLLEYFPEVDNQRQLLKKIPDRILSFLVTYRFRNIAELIRCYQAFFHCDDPAKKMTRIVEMFELYYLYKNEHIVLANAFQACSQELFDFIQRDVQRLEAYFSSSFLSLKAMVELFPTHKDVIFYNILRNENVWLIVVKDNYHSNTYSNVGFDELIHFFPTHREEIVKKIFESGPFPTYLLRDMFCMKRLIRDFPEYTHKIEEAIFGESKMLENLMHFFDDVRDLVKAFPARRHAIEEVLFSNINRLKSRIYEPSFVHDLFVFFPDKRDSIVEIILKDSERVNYLLREPRCIKEFLTLLPEYKEIAIKSMIEDTKNLKRYTASIEDIQKLINAFHEDKQRLADVIIFSNKKILTEFTQPACFSRFLSTFLENGWDRSVIIETLLIKGVSNTLERFDNEEHITQFLTRFKTVNHQVQDDFHKRDFGLFFTRHYHSVILVIHLAGEIGIKWMTELLKFTVLPLERFLTDLPVMIAPKIQDFLKCYFTKHQQEIKGEKGLESWKNILIGMHATHLYKLSNIFYFYWDWDSFFQPYENVTDSTEAFVQQLNRHLLTTILRGMKLPDKKIAEVDCDRLFSMISPNHFAQLAIARINIANTQYGKVLSELINYYITEQSIDDFLHDQNQLNPIGKQIATHNATIRKQLCDNGINVKKALYYPQTYEFTLIPTGFNEQSQMTRYMEILFHYLVQVYETIQQTEKQKQDPDLAKALHAIIKIINSRKATFDGFKNRKYSYIELYQETNWGWLTLIYNGLTSSLKNTSIQDISELTSFREFATHYTEQYDLVSKQSLQPEKKARLKVSHFRIEQWDKTKISTLFLGNEVDCCLAVGSTQFQAIVQRILDDAMLFHVVIDLMTEKPIALTWLYFAYDADNRIYLTANFIEIKAKYGANEFARSTIVNALLYFSGEMYCKDVGIQQFIINQLTYGWNANRLSNFKLGIAPLKDKLGGAFSYHPSSEELYIPAKTTYQYYLTSLQRATNDKAPLFHFYYPEFISKHERDDFVSTKGRVEKTLLDAVSRYKIEHPSMSDTLVFKNVEMAARKQIIDIMGFLFHDNQENAKLTDMFNSIKAEYFFKKMTRRPTLFEPQPAVTLPPKKEPSWSVRFE